MSDSSSWYQRAVARAKSQEQQPQRSVPSQQVARPWAQAPAAAATATVWHDHSQPAPPAQSNTAQKMGQASLTDLLQIQTTTGQATPGVGAQLNPNSCPNCGDALFYERLTRGPRRGPEPAPHCFSCGYNGLFEQGLAGNWGAPG